MANTFRGPNIDNRLSNQFDNRPTVAVNVNSFIGSSGFNTIERINSSPKTNNKYYKQTISKIR